MNKPNDAGPQPSPDPQTLEAGELVLRDAAGKVGVRLTATPIGSKLALYGESGEERASVTVLGEQPGIMLYDAKNKVRATFTVWDKGPYLGMKDANGKTCATLMVTDNGPVLSIGDGDKPRVALCLRKDEPMLYLYDAKGKPRAALGIVFDEPILHLSDANGKRGVRLSGDRARFFPGRAALVCWAALLLLAPAVVHAQPGDPMALLGGALILGAIILTALWARNRWLWWKTKGRAMAQYVADYEARDHERRESEYARHYGDKM
jgi:hypothetical protein